MLVSLANAITAAVEVLHLHKLDWQFKLAKNGKIALLDSGSFVLLSSDQGPEAPNRTGLYWKTECGSRIHSHDILGICGGEDFYY